MNAAPPEMTAEVETGAPAGDPHAPKLSPDDPRLRLRRGGSRTLRTGPLVALVGALLAAVMLAVALAFQAPSPGHGPGDAAPTGAGPAATAPETVRNAATAPAASATRQTDARTPRTPEARSGPTRTAPQGPPRAEEEQFRASNAGILFDAPGGGGAGRAPAPDAPHGAAPLGPEGAAAGPAAGGMDALTRGLTQGLEGGDDDPNGQDRKNAFLDSKGSAKNRDTLATPIQHLRSPYTIQAGTIIPAVLITAINSDLPGPVIGQVRENVYDTVSGNTLLIPQGARLLANYDSMVAWGQERVLVCWNRLLLPDGDSIDLECMPAADLQGAAGLTDRVDEHWFRIVKAAAVASLLAATTQGIAGNTTSYTPTVPQMWANNTAGEVNQVGQQITRRNLTIQPTITVRPGFSVNVMVTKDMVLAPYPDPSARAPVRP